MKLVYFFIFLSLSFNLKAQEVNKVYIDSVFIVAKQTNDFSKKIILISNLSGKVKRMNSQKASILFRYMDSISNDDEIKVAFYKDWSPLLLMKGKKEESKKIRLKGLELAKNINKPRSIMTYYISLTTYFINLAKPDSASYYNHKAEKILWEYPEKTAIWTWNLNFNKAEIERILGNSERQAKWLEEAWKNIENDSLDSRRGFFLAVLTGFYVKTKNIEKQSYYTELLTSYFNKKKLETPDFHFPIESIFLKEYSPEAILNLKNVIATSDSLNNLNALSNTTTTLASALIKESKGVEAIPYLKRTIYKLDQAKYLVSSSMEYNLLRQIYDSIGDYKNAYTTLLEQKKIEDSIRKKEMYEKVADFEIKYETEKKDAQLKVLALENAKAEQQKKLYSFLALGGLLIAGLIGFFLYKNNKKNKLLAKQKELLEATVDEKNVLLKETHHRVKNSFQIVSSLLYLQSENTQNKEAQLAMKEAQNRVRSMVLIHQKLYSKDQLVGIDTKEYFEDLTHDIFESHLDQENKIKYTLDILPIVLGIDTITPLGLILNELITNVIKHAFTSKAKECIMHIEFKRVGENLQLKVEDNGIGMPTDVKNTSFGIKLIKALAKKPKAILEFQKATPKGTIAVLTIKRFTEL